MAVVERWKANLRAWLIAIVREAIRIERVSEQPQYVRAVPRKSASKPMTAPTSEPSFERSEAEALAAQEKYYEPQGL